MRIQFPQFHICVLFLTCTAGLMAGCASTAEIEKRQLSYRGDGGFLSDPCLFGGVTAKAQAHCTGIEFGTEGVLLSANTKVLKALPKGADCKTHVAAVTEKLSADPTLTVQPIYSCPGGGAAEGLCHVSALVTDVTGQQYVVDNGSVLGPGYAGVSRMDQFVAELGSEYWIDEPPTKAQAIGLETLMRNAIPDDFFSGGAGI